MEKIRSIDNIAVALEGFNRGDFMKVAEDIFVQHKLAVREFREGDAVMYKVPVVQVVAQRGNISTKIVKHFAAAYHNNKKDYSDFLRLAKI